jgi:UDP:flavonoid glycosyltransferase YjiC (YdhE family)
MLPRLSLRPIEHLESGVEYVPRPRRWTNRSPSSSPAKTLSFYAGANSAALTITHAGLNTALEALSVGCPMIAIPVGNDQPGIAARLQWLDAGEVLPLGQLSAHRLRPLVSQVLARESYRAAAARLRDDIAKSDGIRRAAGIIEQVLSTKRPVLAAAQADAT